MEVPSRQIGNFSKVQILMAKRGKASKQITRVNTSHGSSGRQDGTSNRLMVIIVTIITAGKQLIKKVVHDGKNR